MKASGCVYEGKSVFMKRPQNLHAELGIEPRASRMLSGCDTTTLTVPCKQRPLVEPKKALFFRLWARAFLALCFLIGVCCVSSFLVLCGGVSAFVVRGACTYGSLLEPAPAALMSALMKMYL